MILDKSCDIRNGDIQKENDYMIEAGRSWSALSEDTPADESDNCSSK